MTRGWWLVAVMLAACGGQAAAPARVTEPVASAPAAGPAPEESPRAKSQPLRQQRPLDAHLAARYAGTYRFAAMGVSLQVAYADGALRAYLLGTRGERTDEMELSWLGDDRFVMRGLGTNVEFLVVDGHALEMHLVDGEDILVGLLHR